MSHAALQLSSESARKSSGGATSLRVGPAHDVFEHEADQAAEMVTKGENQRVAWSLSRVGASSLQRECSCGGTCDECKKKKEGALQRKATASFGSTDHAAPASVSNVLGRSGRALDGGTRRFMESRFGYDFSRVRIHNDDEAAASARNVSANAYTVGSSIVFGHGKYAPDSSAGRRLLAHELAHVVQQSGTGAPPAFSGDSGLEAEAHACARAVDSGVALPKVRRESGVGIARDASPADQTLIEVKFPDGVKQLTPDQFADYKRRALHSLRVDLNGVIESADYGRKVQTDLLAEYQGGVESLWDVVKKPKALIGIASDIKAGVTPPYLGMWGYPKGTAQLGLASCDQEDLAAAARHLRHADEDLRDALRTWNEYREATIGGAEGVVSNLETVRDVSFAVALAAGAAVAAPVIAAGVAATGATGATATVLTTAGTALATGAGGATLRGGSAALGSYAATGKVDMKAVKAEAVRGLKEGAVTGLTAGLGSSLSAASQGAKLAQPLIQAAARRCLTEAGVNVAGEVTTEVLDRALPAPGVEAQTDSPKPVLPGPARAALTGCLSGALGAPVAKLGRTGAKVSEHLVGAGVGYVDARLSGQSNREALLAAAQTAATSAAVAHGHAGTEHARAAKAGASKPAGQETIHSGSAPTHAEPHAGTAAGQRPERPGAEARPEEKLKQELKNATGHDTPPAVMKEEAKAKEPIGDGHDAVVTEHGVGKCSPSPCPVIHVEYAKELQEHPWAKKRNREIQALRKTNPAQAAKEAARFVRVLEMLRNRAVSGAPPKFKAPKTTTGIGVFGELRQEMGLKSASDHPGGIRQSVADAVAAGFVNPDGSPKKVGAAVQPHGSASTVREEMGLTGKQAQSAHIGPTSALRKLSKYSRSGALTTLLPPETHAAFDAHWKEWAQGQRRQGKTHATVSELHAVMVQAIEQTPNLSKETKGALAWQLHMELFQQLGLKPGARIELPYKNISRN